jgi:putative membrane protein
MEQPVKQDPKDFFAAERTFLAWIRTGLGLIGIGFAVSRFSLFLREIAATDSHAPVRPTGVSMWSGVALVGLGVVVILASVLRHIEIVKQLQAGSWLPGRGSRDAVILGIVLAAVGMGMCFYLVLVR